MTREEIIEHLDSIVGTYEILLGHGVNSDILDVDDIEAIKEAISALSAEGEYIKKSDLMAKVVTETLSDYTEDDVIYVDVINQLPTYSFPDREKGEWIKIQSGDDKFPESIVCSKCKNENSHLDFDEHGEPIGKVFITSKFCPNCGTDMRGNADAER